MGAVNAGTGDFGGRLNLPIYTTGNYPAGNEGDLIYDQTIGSIFIYNGQGWVPPGFGRKPSASGGNLVQNINGSQHHFFWSSGTLNVTQVEMHSVMSSVAVAVGLVEDLTLVVQEEQEAV